MSDRRPRLLKCLQRQVIDLSGMTFVSTHGPAPGDIIPQVFFQFRGVSCNQCFAFSTAAP